MPAPKSRNGQESLLDHLTASVETLGANNLLSLDRYYRSASLLLRQVQGAGSRRRAGGLELALLPPAVATPTPQRSSPAAPASGCRRASTGCSITRSSYMSCCCAMSGEAEVPD